MIEQIDINQINLKDTGIYEGDSHSFYHLLHKNNITTVGQLLNDNLINQLMQRCKNKTRIELRGFISLLKYKYLGISLINNELLEQTSKIDTNYEISFYPVDFASLGLHKHYQNKIKNIAKTGISKEKNIENKKLIEFIKEIIDSGKYWNHSAFIEILKLHIESYEESKKLTQSTIVQENQIEDKNPSQQEHDILVILKDQLVKLVSVRDSLDAQIEDIQQKIDELTNSKTEGGDSK